MPRPSFFVVRPHAGGQPARTAGCPLACSVSVVILQIWVLRFSLRDVEGQRRHEDGLVAFGLIRVGNPVLDVDRPVPRLGRDDVDDAVEIRTAPKSPVLVIGVAILRLAGATVIAFLQEINEAIKSI